MCFCSLTCVDCASRWHVCIITSHKLHWLARWQTQLLMFSLHSRRCSSNWLTATQKLGLRTASRPSRRRFLTLDPSTASLQTTAKASPTLVTTSVSLLTFYLVTVPCLVPHMVPPPPFIPLLSFTCSHHIQLKQWKLMIEYLKRKEACRTLIWIFALPSYVIHSAGEP